jgi:peptidoglycan hydrolase-like protein with peptidoglycan-binding domain
LGSIRTPKISELILRHELLSPPPNFQPGNLLYKLVSSTNLAPYKVTRNYGYEEIRKQGLPYPSIRTLQSGLNNLKFTPGILDEVFGVLKLKVSI